MSGSLLFGDIVPAIVVKGRPVSINASPATKAAWKDKVREAALLVYPTPLEDDDLEIEITYFCDGQTDIDTDNISKPICDSLNGIVYEDDKQLIDRNARRRDLNKYFYVKGIEPSVAVALAEGEEFVSIKISNVGERVARI